MSMMPLLSFCVPVYNFGAFLPETLDSIRPQMSDAMEIVVLDGASTDNTPEFMERVCAEDPRVRYVLRAQRGGIDADIAACVDEARGEYFWLFSGDDILRKGGAAYVNSVLPSGADVHLLTHTECTLRMEFMRIYRALAAEQPYKADLGRSDDRRAWLERACNTEALFSFASTLVIRRSTWNSVPARQDFDGSGWGHAARLLEIAKRRLEVIYHPEPMVDRRGENDSFRERGIVNRLSIAVDGYHRIAREFARDRNEAEQIRRLVRAELPITIFIGARTACRANPGRESRADLDRLVNQCHGGTGVAGWLKLILYRFFPATLESQGRKVLALWRRWTRSS